MQILWKASLYPIGAMGRILKYAISFFQKAVLVRREAEPKKEGGMILSRPLLFPFDPNLKLGDELFLSYGIAVVDVIQLQQISRSVQPPPLDFFQ